MYTFSLSVLILVLPAIFFIILGLFGKYMKPVVAGLLGTVSLAIITALAYLTAYQYFFVVGKGADGAFQAIQVFNMEWLRFTEFLQVDLGMYLDRSKHRPLSRVLLLF